MYVKGAYRKDKKTFKHITALSKCFELDTLIESCYWKIKVTDELDNDVLIVKDVAICKYGYSIECEHKYFCKIHSLYKLGIRLAERFPIEKSKRLKITLLYSDVWEDDIQTYRKISNRLKCYQTNFSLFDLYLSKDKHIPNLDRNLNF